MSVPRNSKILLSGGYPDCKSPLFPTTVAMRQYCHSQRTAHHQYQSQLVISPLQMVLRDKIENNKSFHLREPQ